MRESGAQIKFKKTSKIQWKWLGRAIGGVVEDVFFESVVREIKGKKITRHGSKENPAYLVRSSAGNLALKLETELTMPRKQNPARKKPTIF